VTQTAKHAPTTCDRPFHLIKEEYAGHSLAKGADDGLITCEDETLIEAFVAELRATSGIGTSRANKITTALVLWRRFIGPYTSNTLTDLYTGVARLKQARNNGKPYKQNTIRDYITFLKRFYAWLIEEGYASIPSDKVKRIKPPAWDTMTKTASQLLTEEEVLAMIKACMSSRDRALISTLYEGGFRVKEVGTLTWGQVQFDQYGVVINVNVKTEKPRYVRVVASAPYLASWRNDYPYEPYDEALVFLTSQRRPLRYATVSTQLKKIAKRAGVPKPVTPHLFRHSRITHMHREGYHESTVKQMMWGNQSTKMMATYTHLTGEDIDDEVLRMNGIDRGQRSESSLLTAIQCPHCHTINGPSVRYCGMCGRPLTHEEKQAIEDVAREIEATPEFKQIMELVKNKLRMEGN